MVPNIAIIRDTIWAHLDIKASKSGSKVPRDGARRNSLSGTAVMILGMCFTLFLHVTSKD